jgi:hypothetical protein
MTDILPWSNISTQMNPQLAVKADFKSFDLVAHGGLGPSLTVDFAIGNNLAG